MSMIISNYLAGIPVPKIAAQYRCSVQTIYNRLRQAGTKPNRDGSSHVLNYARSYLDEFRRRFLDGLLLGDGCIRRQRDDANAFLSLGFKHKEVRDYFVAPFLCYNPWFSHKEPFRAETKRHPDFTKQHNRWYPGGIKTVPSDLQLDPLVCFNWFIGDGNYHQVKRYIRLSIHCFQENEKERLVTLLDRLGFRASLHSDGQLSLTKASSSKFLQYMLVAGQPVPICYRYKFGETNVNKHPPRACC